MTLIQSSLTINTQDWKGCSYIGEVNSKVIYAQPETFRKSIHYLTWYGDKCAYSRQAEICDYTLCPSETLLDNAYRVTL